jgi:hypothetical protein
VPVLSQVSGGQVIQIRSSVEGMFKGAEATSRPDIILVQTPVLDMMQGKGGEGSSRCVR